jgi:hypothetical protein
MVVCINCRKTITDPDDLNIVSSPWALKTISYCNACSARLSKQRKGVFYSHPLNSAKYMLSGIGFAGIWVTLLTVAVWSTISGTVNYAWHYLGLFTLPLAVWFLYWRNAQNKLNEVKNTPKQKAAKVYVNKKAGRCDLCRAYSTYITTTLGFISHNLCDNCFAKRRRSLSGGLLGYPWSLPVNSAGFVGFALLMSLLFLTGIILRFRATDPYDKLILTIGSVIVGTSSLWNWSLVFRANRKLSNHARRQQGKKER